MASFLGKPSQRYYGILTFSASFLFLLRRIVFLSPLSLLNMQPIKHRPPATNTPGLFRHIIDAAIDHIVILLCAGFFGTFCGAILQKLLMMQQFRLLFSKKLFDFFHNRTVKSVNRLRHQNSAVVENNVRFLLFCLFTDKLYKSLLLHILVLITRLPKSFGIQQKKAGPSAWICTTSYLPNALQSAAKKEELTAASPPDVLSLIHI